jgi:hypothetical protein
MLARFFHVSHNTHMLGIKYAYLMIKKINKDSFEFVWKFKSKEIKIWLWRRNRRKIFRTRKKILKNL